MDPVTVFLLDDHEVVRQGLRTVLERSGDIKVIGESGSAVEAASRIPALKPDVAILDGRLPDGSGVDVCREIRSVDPSIRALILTSYDDDEALDVGAGLRPELTGQGHGAAFLGAILEFGRRHFATRGFRATIASWNERALRMAERAGFERGPRFVSPAGVEFTVLLHLG